MVNLLGESKGTFYLKFDDNLFPLLWIQDGKYFNDDVLDFLI